MTFVFDLSQQHVYEQIRSEVMHVCEMSLLKRALRAFNIKNKQSGIYLHGPVGGGKTTLMRKIYQQITLSKQECHFDTFFAELHLKLKEHDIDTLAKEIRKKSRVLWIDELQIYDVATAMLLLRLVPALMKQKIIVLITGNVAPIDFYKGGLNRDQFEKFIPYFISHFLCLSLDEGIDYRLLPKINDSAHIRDRSVDSRFFLHSDKTLSVIEDLFRSISPDDDIIAFDLPLNSRNWILKKTLKCAVLISFDELATGNRAFDDYRRLVQMFRVIFVTNVPIFNDKNRDACRRFMAFIDIIYAEGCQFYMSAEAEISKLYQDKANFLPFERSSSRLAELL